MKVTFSTLATAIATAAISVFSAGSVAWGQDLSTPDKTCTNCSILANAGIHNGWYSNGADASPGNNDIGNQTSTGEVLYDNGVTLALPASGRIQGYLLLLNRPAADYSWNNVATSGFVDGQQYTATFEAIGVEASTYQCAPTVTVTIEGVIATVPVNCATSGSIPWVPISVTFIADGPVSVNVSTIDSRSAMLVADINAVQTNNLDTDGDGIDDASEAAGEENNPCLPATSAYTIANCADLTVTKTLVSDSSANCSNGAEWQIQVANPNGPAAVDGVVVTDTINTGTIASMAVTASSTSSASCSTTGIGTSSATCTLNENLAPGNTVTIRVCS